MKTAGYRMSLTALTLLLMIPIAGNAQKLYKDGRYWVGEIEKKFTVQKGGTLILDDIRGDVTVETWDRNEVYIHEVKSMDIFQKGEAESAMRESESGYTQTENTIRVGGGSFTRKWIDSDFTIQVPKEFNCHIDTKGGDLQISGLTGSVKTSTGGGDVSLEDIDGVTDVKTGGGDVEVIHVTKDLSVATGGGDIEIVKAGGTVMATTGGGDVSVQNAGGRTRITTGGGDVEVADIRSDVQITTGGGEISLSNIRGNAEITTGGGEIEAEEIHGDFNATTGGGSISLTTVIGNVNVKTAGGDIDLDDIQGGLEVGTVGGDVEAVITLKDFSKNHAITIKTGGGDIVLTIPADMPATIEAEIRQRSRRWEDYQIQSDFPLKIITREEGRYRYIEATGDINGGGDPIQIKSHGGDISIQKL
jgi:DUF4097 and DUF4098 domain-containing protein YvlB